VVVVVVESVDFIPVSMFMLFMPVSFFMPVSAGAGVMAGVVVVDVESVMVELVSFVLQPATANRAATTTRRFIYDLLEWGGDSGARVALRHTTLRARTLRARMLPAESY
jgi:hypothetical protein